MDLIQAVSAGNIEEVTRLLQTENIDIEFRAPNSGATSLIYATNNGINPAAMVKLLLAAGADVNVANNNGVTPLIYAASNSNGTSSLETVKLLLEYGAKVEAKMTNNETALFFASYHVNTTSSLDTMKLLIQYGADVNAIIKNLDSSILMMAVNATNTTSSNEAVELLLDSGADINLPNSARVTPLMAAASSSTTTSTLDTVRLLLDYGADPFLIDNTRKDALDYCQTEECKRVISDNIWSRMNTIDNGLSEQYAKSGDFRLPREIWRLILLKKRQEKLCRNLTDPKNRLILMNFALMLDIPIGEDTTKADLCSMISRQLAWGSRYTEESRKFFVSEDAKAELVKTAARLGINVNQNIDGIFNDLYAMIKL